MPTVSTANARVKDVAGIRRRVILTYTGPVSYATGGDSFPTTSIPSIGVLETVLGSIAWNGSAVRLLAYDYTNQKFVWYIPNTGAEVAAAVDLSAFTVRLEFIGR